ncbi:MAG: histidine-type phosphatase [Rickettsiales bacterium]|nr:histidine-type phosphatase [Rickettsiales bacterium]
MELILAIDIIRHADRTSIHCIPGIFTNSEKSKLGELTPKGKEDALELGKNFKKYYIEEHSLLSHLYEPEAIIIKSSDFQRTKETAKCIIHGMYDSQLGSVKISILPKQEDFLFLGFLYAAGQEMKGLTRPQHDFTGKVSKDVMQEIGVLLRRINDKLDTKFNDISDVVKIADVIKTDKVQRRFLLEKLGEDIVASILHLTKLVFIDIFRLPEVAHAGAGLLVRQVIEQMIDKKQNQKTPYKYVLFLGHDINLFAAMSLLDFPLGDVPYLANLRFELFQKDEKEFFVKVFCIDEYARICSEEYCPFDQFITMISSKLNN